LIFNKNISFKEKLKLLNICKYSSRYYGSLLRYFNSCFEILAIINKYKINKAYCYSFYNLEFLEYLFKLKNIHYNFYLKNRTKFHGEFAFELLSVIPYAYWLFKNNLLKETISAKSTKSLYYFSKNHKELYKKRSFNPISEYPLGTMETSRIIETKWLPPPYKEIYKNEVFKYDKPLLIICNKYHREHCYRPAPGEVINYLPIKVLFELIEILKDKYQIVYNRPMAKKDIIFDHQEELIFNDMELIKQNYPEVILIQDLHKKHPELDFNTIQLMLFANSNHFITVLGGSAYLAAYFKGINIVLAKEGYEVKYKAYKNWFSKFSGAKTLTTNNYKKLIKLVKKEFL
jgi:hypothetical protein